MMRKTVTAAALKIMMMRLIPTTVTVMRSTTEMLTRTILVQQILSIPKTMMILMQMQIQLMMTTTMTIPHQLQHQLHQLPGHDNDELAVLQVGQQFG